MFGAGRRRGTAFRRTICPAGIAAPWFAGPASVAILPGTATFFFRVYEVSKIRMEAG